MPFQLVNELDDATHYLPDTEEVFRRRYRAASYLVHHSACAWGAETREHLQLYVPYARSMFVTKIDLVRLFSLSCVCPACRYSLNVCVSSTRRASFPRNTHTRTTRDATRHLVPLATHPPAFPCLAPPAPSHMTWSRDMCARLACATCVCVGVCVLVEAGVGGTSVTVRCSVSGDRQQLACAADHVQFVRDSANCLHVRALAFPPTSPGHEMPRYCRSSL